MKCVKATVEGEVGYTDFGESIQKWCTSRSLWGQMSSSSVIYAVGAVWEIQSG